jgi:hypothetical protein
MKKARLVSVLGLVAAIGLIAGAGAIAKPAFKPQAGKYSGTIKTAGGTAPVPGTVIAREGGYEVQVLAGGSAKCTDGTILTLPLGAPAKVKGKTFKVTMTATNPNLTGGSRNVLIKMSGHFTSPTSFTGTASATTEVEPTDLESKACTTGTLSFSLTK